MAMTGTITVLFTDLVGSTELLSDLGDDDADRLRRIYFKILRDTVTNHSGREVKNLGDGIMAVFSSAIDALRCATDIQRQVHAHNEDKGASLRVRIGLEVGEPIAEEEDYFGTPVVIAKRLCDSAQGGQIVVSELVTRLIGSRGRFDFKDIGLLSLRGIEEAVPARELVWEQPSDAPVIRPPTRPGSSARRGSPVGEEDGRNGRGTAPPAHCSADRRGGHRTGNRRARRVRALQIARRCHRAAQ